MISSVLAKNLKNRSFEFTLAPKTIIIGPNGAGKTAILQALMLAIEGATPGIGKKNEAILDAVGCSAGPLYVEATIGKTQIGRKYEQDRASVKQTMMVDRRKADAKAFGAALNECKAPRIVAVDEFLSLPSKRMIAFLAGKVGGDELEALSTKIDKAKTELSHWQGKLRESESYVSKLSGNIAQLKLPPGTLAEVRAEIRDKQAQLKESQDQLGFLEAQERAEAEAKYKADQELKKQLAAEAEAKALPIQDQAPPEGERLETFPSRMDLASAIHRAHPETSELIALGKEDHASLHRAVEKGPADSIQEIIDQIRAVDCPTCKGGTALMVAMRELRKWRTK